MEQLALNRVGRESRWEIKEVSIEEANQIMYDTIKAWQRARREIFAYPMKPNPDERQLALWRALGDAEHALMDL